MSNTVGLLVTLQYNVEFKTEAELVQLKELLGQQVAVFQKGHSTATLDKKTPVVSVIEFNRMIDGKLIRDEG